jgi:hypothetical protein
MSQGDYIRRKRVANQLKTQKKLSPVLNAGEYIDYKEFSLENTVVSTKTNYNNLVPSNVSVIFDMHTTSVSTCPQFILCSGTNQRPNRVLRSLAPSAPLALKPIHKTIDKTAKCNYC